jgi:hypothetical protein
VGTVLVFEYDFTLEDVIGIHSLDRREALRVTNIMLLGRPLSYRLTL